MSNDVPESGVCIGCKEVVSKQEGFCYGCKSYICEDCTTNHVSGFNHEGEDHLLHSACCGSSMEDGFCMDCSEFAEAID